MSDEIREDPQAPLAAPVPEEAPPAKFDRRSFLTVAGAAAVAGWATVRFPKPGVPLHRSAAATRSSVAIIKAPSYNTELAQRILDLAKHPEQWGAMGRAGREIVEKEFNTRTLGDELVTLYRQLLP